MVLWQWAVPGCHCRQTDRSVCISGTTGARISPPVLLRHEGSMARLVFITRFAPACGRAKTAAMRARRERVTTETFSVGYYLKCCFHFFSPFPRPRPGGCGSIRVLQSAHDHFDHHSTTLFQRRGQQHETQQDSSILPSAPSTLPRHDLLRSR